MEPAGHREPTISVGSLVKVKIASTKASSPVLQIVLRMRDELGRSARRSVDSTAIRARPETSGEHVRITSEASQAAGGTSEKLRTSSSRSNRRHTADEDSAERVHNKGVTWQFHGGSSDGIGWPLTRCLRDRQVPEKPRYAIQVRPRSGRNLASSGR